MIALTKTGNRQTKLGVAKKLLISASVTEALWVARTLVNHLRTGAVGMTVLSAVTKAVHQWRKEPISDVQLAEEAVRRALAQCPDWNIVAPALMQHGYAELNLHCSITPGMPGKQIFLIAISD